MLILYLLPARPPSFVISLLLLIWCNVMKWLEVAPWGWGGPAWLAQPGWAPLPGSCSSPSDCPSMGRGGGWGSGGGRTGAGATRVSSRGQRGSGIGVGGAGRDHPLRLQHPPTLITPPPRLSFKCMCNYTPTCPPFPHERKLPQHLIPTGRAP